MTTWNGFWRSFGFIAAIALLVGGVGCDHDPTVLETHPLDLTGATSASVESVYLTMSDGVRIAVDIYVPENYPGGTVLPAIIEMTRYWRSRGDEIPYHIRRGLQRGFTWVVMDERGTGASFGDWKAPLTPRALQDAYEVMDWMVGQEWSNGFVGASGISYPGMAAHRLSAIGHPALRAVVPMSDTYDLYEDLLFPGGVFNEVFLQAWSDAILAFDRSSEISIGSESFVLSPVDADPTGELLAEAIAGHSGNLNLFQAFQSIRSRDNPSSAGFTLDQASTRSLQEDIDESGVAVYQWGSWMDSGSADGVIRGFMESTGPRRATIGAWTHDLEGNSFFGEGARFPSVPSFESQWEEALNFFDDLLRKRKPNTDRVLRYYTMGEGLWKATSTWPIPGSTRETFYLGPDGSLSTTPPSEGEGEDLYEVDFQVLSAMEPRWVGPLFAAPWYPDRVERDRDLLVYQTSPLQEDMEVTGYPSVHLQLSSSHTDGAYVVYLEEVSPQGSVTYVTEGVLRGIHRKVTEDPSPWARPIPHHSFLSADETPQVPGQVFELSLGLEPTSYLFKQGHRIRIALAGHDAAVFRRIPQDGTPVLRIQRNSSNLSSLELPVVRDRS